MTCPGKETPSCCGPVPRQEAQPCRQPCRGRGAVCCSPPSLTALDDPGPALLPELFGFANLGRNWASKEGQGGGTGSSVFLWDFCSPVTSPWSALHSPSQALCSPLECPAASGHVFLEISRLLKGPSASSPLCCLSQLGLPQRNTTLGSGHRARLLLTVLEAGGPRSRSRQAGHC